MKLDFYADPGHGWLAVPLEMLDSLDLIDQISPYSYLRGRFAHLEEDCDYSLFAKAMRDRDVPFTLREHHTDNRSRIRGYESYSPARARRNLAQLRNTLTRQGVLAHALHHARQAWCWDDESHIRELVRDAFARGDSFTGGAAVREWIDQLAEHYDLIRPEPSWGIAKRTECPV